MSWEIKSKNNEVKFEVRKVEYNDEWMQERYVTVTIESPAPINFQIGDYLIYRGERFEINYDPGKIKSAEPYDKGNAFRYENVKFNSLADELTRCDFLDVVLNDNQLHFTGLPKFSFYGGVTQLADRIQANLDKTYDEGEWNVVIAPEFADTTELNVTIDTQKVSGVLADVLVNQFKTYYTIKERTLTIGAAGVPADHLFQWGPGKGLYEIEENAEADQQIVTRLRAYGSTRNLPHRYYNSLTDADGMKLIPDNMAVQYLMLPAFPYTTQDPYIDSPNIDALGVREDTIFFDGSGELEEIYPSIEGMTAEQLKAAGVPCNSDGALDVLVSAEQMTDNGVGKIEGDAFEGNATTTVEPATFKVSIKDVGFDINDHLTTETATISFKTGMLGGRDFEIVECKKEGDNYVLELNRVYDEDIKLWFPYKDYNAKKDDRFVLLNTRMPEVYIKAASQRLLKAAEKWLSKNDYSRSIYAPKIDENFMARQHDVAIASGGTIKSLHDTLCAGMQLLFEDKDLGIDAAIFIDHLTIIEGDGSIPTYEVVLKEEKSVGRLDKMQNQIDSLAAGQGQGSGGYNASQIRSLINAYGGQLFLSKLKDDRSAGQIASDKGLEVGKFLAGVSGAKIGIDAETGQTFGEMDKLLIRVKAYFETLTMIEANNLAGKQYITPGGSIKCTSVEEIKDANGNVTAYRCFFLSEQDGEKTETKMVVGDQAISEMFNAKTGTANKVSNHRYWRLVTGVSNDAYTDYSGNHYGYVELSKSDCETGSGVPKAGDVISQFGNRTDQTRRAAMIFSTVDVDAPSIKLFTGIGSGTTNAEHYSLNNRDIISYGYDPVKGHAYFRCYGDVYIGSPDGKTFVKYDQDAEKLDIKASISIQSTIGNKTIDNYVNDAANTAANAAKVELQGKIDTLQQQIDGVIESFNGQGAPTLSNYPANEWATDEERKRHDRDIYTDITPYVDDVTTPTSGQSWKWYYNSPTDYGWTKIADSEAVKALQLAQMSVLNTDVLYIQTNSPTVKPALPTVNTQGQITNYNGWSTTSPTWKAGEYIWQCTYVRKGDGTATFSDPTCISGKDGKDGASVTISSQAVRYSTAHTATQPADSTFTLTAVPTLSAGQYLWSRTEVVYSNGQSTKSYAVSRVGTDGVNGTAWGNGKMRFIDPTFKKGMNSMAAYNNLSNGTVNLTRMSDSTAPNDSGWVVRVRNTGTAQPSLGGFHQYINGRLSATFICRYIAKIPVGYTILGAYNNLGTTADGFKIEWLTSTAGTGKWEEYLLKIHVADSSDKPISNFGHVYISGTPQGTEDNPVDWLVAYATIFDMDANGEFLIESQSVTYAKTTNATQPADSAFTHTSIGTVGLGAGDYLWTKTEVNYSDGTTTKSYTVSRIGADGINGTPGATGADGKTTYVHFAYASGITGSLPHPTAVTGFATTAFAGAKYIGVCTDYNQADPTTNVAQTYEWSEYKGDDGNGIDRIEEEYYLSTSRTALQGGSWSTTRQPWVAGHFYWTRSHIYYTDGTDKTVGEVCVTGEAGASGTSVLAQYSADGTNWHPSFVAGDVWMRTSSDGGNTWTPAVRIQGQDGKDGQYRKWQWAKNNDAVNPPTSGWQDTPLTASAGEYVWMRSGIVVPPATTPAAWEAATRLTGDKGQDGQSVYLLDLTDEVKGIACNASGTPLSNTIPTSQASVFKGSQKLTSGITYSIAQATGVSATVTAAGVVTPTNLTADNATIVVQAVVDGLTLQSTISIYKVKPGAQGSKGDTGAAAVVYSIQTSVDNISKSMTGELSATSLTVTKYKTTGNTARVATTDKILKYQRIGIDSAEIQLSANGGAATSTISGITAACTAIVVTLYDTDGVTVLDRERIPVIADASDLEIGGRNLILQSDTLYENSNYLTASYDTSIPLVVGDEYTVTIWGLLGAGKRYFGLWMNSGSYHQCDIKEVGAGVYRATFKVTETVTVLDKVHIYAVASSTVAVSIINRIKLEKGNVGTDWTPAPEDIKKRIDSLDYLKAAMKENSALSGGLFLTSLIKVGQGIENGDKISITTTRAGMNGIIPSELTEAQKARVIASWWGGDMVDKFYGANGDLRPVPLASGFASALVRMDGTGYLAKGNIKWDTDGSGSVAGGNLYWDAAGNIHLGADVYIGSATDKTVQTILEFINGINTLLIPMNGDTPLTWGQVAANPSAATALRSKVSFYSDYAVAGLGKPTELAGSGTGGTVDILQEWSQYDASSGKQTALSAYLGYDLYSNKVSKGDLLAVTSRVAALESGSALSLTVSGTGNAITSIVKSGNAIAATKGATFLTAQDLTNYYTRAESNSLFAPKVVYSFGNGCLVKLKSLAATNTMVTLLIEGNSYNGTGLPIKSIFQFYNYQSGNYIGSYSGIHYGKDFGDVKAFNYNGYIYVWFKQVNGYVTFAVTAICSAEGAITGNAVDIITNAEMPTSGVTRLVTITPQVGATQGWADGKFALASALSNYVTLDTEQEIRGKKTFSTAIGLATVSDDWNMNRNGNTLNWLHSGGTTASNSPGTYWSGVSFMTNYVGFQLATYGGATENLRFRKVSDGSVWTDWRDILHTGNYSTYLDSRYLLASTYTASDILTKLKAVDGAGSGLDADLLDGWHRDDVRKGVLAFTYFQGTNAAGGCDLNTLAPDGGIINNYGSGSYWANAPAGAPYGFALHLKANYNLGGMLFADINHNSATDVTRTLWWRASGTVQGEKAWGKWHQIAFTDSNVASADVATKLGTSTVGSTIRPIYLSGGIPTLCTYAFGNGSGNAALNNGVLNTNLNADMLDGLHATSFYATKQLFSKADYQHYVVLLWKVNEQTNHRINGKLYTRQGGASRYQAANIDMWYSRWSAGFDQSLRLDTFGLGSGWKLVTCTYNGELWYALQHTNAQACNAYFVGTSDNIDFTAVHYYTSNTATVVNSSVNGSIEDQISLLAKPYIGSNAYALVSDNVASATKLQTARTLWGQSFDGSGNVSGHMGSVGNITMSGYLNMNSSEPIIQRQGEAILRAANAGLVITPYDAANGFIALRCGNKGITSGAAELRILASGYVGIGTAAPAYRLDVNGTARVTSLVIGDIVLTDDNGALKIQGSAYATGNLAGLGAPTTDGGSVGGGSGVDELRLLSDVLLSSPASGQALVYNGSKWVNQDINTGLDTTQLATYLTTNNYAKKSDIPSLSGYATQTWINSQGFLKSITKAQVEAVLTGNITSHTHSQYLTAHQALDHINYVDKRSEDLAPFGTWTHKGVQYSLKYNTADGLSDGGTYHGLMTLHQWSDASGGAAHQLSFTDRGNIYHRYGTSAWSAYAKLLDSNNYASVLDGSYLPLTGGTVNGNVDVEGQLTAAALAVVEVAMVGGDTFVGGTLTVNAETALYGPLTALEAVSCLSTVELYGDVSVRGTLTPYGDVCCQGGLEVNYMLFAYGGIAADGDVEFSDGFISYGDSLIEANLNVLQSITATGDITAYGYLTGLGAPSSSDARLKTKVADFMMPLDVIADMPCLLFRWNNRPELPVALGTYAQYFLDKAPAAVHTDEKGYYSLEYAQLALAACKTLAQGERKHDRQLSLLLQTVARLAKMVPHGAADAELTRLITELNNMAL